MHQHVEIDPSHELDSPPWRRVESTLMAVADSIQQCYDDRLASLGLTLSSASLLAYVAEFGPVNQTRAAEHLGKGRASTGSQVDRLEAAGLLTRVADPADRRVWNIAVTPAGVALAAQVAGCDEVIRAELRHGISRDERQLLASLLVRLQRNIKSPNTTSDNTPSSTGEVPT